MPQYPQPLPEKQILPGLRKTWRDPAQQAEMLRQYPHNRRSHCSRHSRGNESLGDSHSLHTLLLLTPGSLASNRSCDHEWSQELRDGHGDLPDEHGTANAPAETDSGQKTATDHTESGPNEAGSGQKTATGHTGTPSESEHDEIDSCQKTAIDHVVTVHGRQRPRRVPTMTLSTA